LCVCVCVCVIVRSLHCDKKLYVCMCVGGVCVCVGRCLKNAFVDNNKRLLCKKLE